MCAFTASTLLITRLSLPADTTSYMLACNRSPALDRNNYRNNANQQASASLPQRSLGRFFPYFVSITAIVLVVLVVLLYKTESHLTYSVLHITIFHTYIRQQHVSQCKASHFQRTLIWSSLNERIVIKQINLLLLSFLVFIFIIIRSGPILFY